MDKTPRSGGPLCGNQAGIAGGQHCRRTVENSTVWAMDGKDVVILLAFCRSLWYDEIVQKRRNYKRIKHTKEGKIRKNVRYKSGRKKKNEREKKKLQRIKMIVTKEKPSFRV